MVVEDDEVTRTAYCRLFVLKGADVICASSVGQAMAEVRRGPIDAVLLDLWLGDGSGETFLIESRAAGFRGRIVVHSGACHDRLDADRLLAMGADAVLPKPSAFADIWSAMIPDAVHR